MSAAPPPTPAGWYPDPDGSPNTRWFDGTEWTNRFQPPPAHFAATPPAEPGRVTIHYGFVLLAVFAFLGTAIPCFFWFGSAASVPTDPNATQSDIDASNAASGVLSLFGFGWLLWGGMWTLIWAAFAINHTLKARRN
ncbi:DUF2510 domain-containing protein [Mycobacterium camsae]|uniref:DUF2510 domain-containing protein n=1 Tax=Mycobacterium gordonae TaxID=1778 RepID=UPI00197D4585|nr:DUF2510 domain-containing protein [Mycobacterium gordonae]